MRQHEIFEKLNRSIRFYDDIGTFKVEELFENLQNLKARDYLKLYQMMYQDLIEHQQLNYFENIDKEENNEK